MATYLETAENKSNELNWTRFNFLENLLVFCAEKTFNAEEESHVRFGVSKEPRSDVLCLLFKIDRRDDPLVTDRRQPRPDYLVLYKTRTSCIFTIVEMKGKTENGLERGIEQIVNLRDILKREISEHFPLAAGATYQGILLCPPNAQVPAKQIAREAGGGFTIIPLLYQHKAELFPYISKRNVLTDRYVPQSFPHSDELTYLERLIVHRALPRREEDAKYYSEYRPGGNTGLYINYALSNEREYAALIANQTGNAVVVKAEGDTYLRAIQEALAGVGWASKFRCSKL